MTENKKVWRLSDVWVFLKNSFVAILQGKFLLRLNVTKYFVHIVYVFFVFVLIIWVSLQIDRTMEKMEEGKKKLNEMEIIHSQKIFYKSRAEGKDAVRERLVLMGSELSDPTEPASVIE